MKHTKQTSSASNHHLGSHQPPCPKPAIFLSVVAEEFLRARMSRKAKHRPESVHAIVGLAACLGDLPIGRVTPSDVEVALRHSHPLPGVRKRLVPHIKDFFRRARTRGYLPADRPFPAGTLNVRVPRTQPPILSLPQVKALLSGTEDVELCLASALILLSGIRAAELEQLSWETVTPGFCIEVPWKRSWPGRTRPRWVFGGLDGWLRPFYGCRGPVISPRTLRLRLRPFSRRPGLRIKPGDLRHTFQAYNLGFAGSLGRVARGMGATSVLHRHPLFRPATESQADKFFALTPESIGVTDWPQRVARYLKDRQRPPTAGRPGGSRNRN